MSENPSKIIYLLNITENEDSPPQFSFDALSPFPAISVDDSIHFGSTVRKVASIRHNFIQHKDCIEAFTIVVVAPDSH